MFFISLKTPTRLFGGSWGCPGTHRTHTGDALGRVRGAGRAAARALPCAQPDLRDWTTVSNRGTAVCIQWFPRSQVRAEACLMACRTAREMCPSKDGMVADGRLHRAQGLLLCAGRWVPRRRKLPGIVSSCRHRSLPEVAPAALLLRARMPYRRIWRVKSLVSRSRVCLCAAALARRARRPATIQSGSVITRVGYASARRVYSGLIVPDDAR